MRNDLYDSAGQEYAVTLYLNLLKHSLVNWYYGHTAMHEMVPWSWKRRLVKSALAREGFVAAHPAPIPTEIMEEGKGQQPDSYTLVGLKRLTNLEECIQSVLANGVEGDFLEAGVWRGGSCIFMRGVLKALNVTDRKVWVADSFKGLPTPDITKYPHDKVENLHELEFLAVSLDEVRANFERYDLLDEQVAFIEGYFCDTLPSAPINKLAVLRLDGDMYQSTMETLDALYPKLSAGGYVIIDDFARQNCAQAVHDYRKQQDISDEIKNIDWTAVYWQKST